MSLLTQFYPSSSGGGGSSIVGVVSGYPYGSSGVAYLRNVAYNPVTGWYYMAVTTPGYDQAGYTLTGINVIASPDGINWNLSWPAMRSSGGYGTNSGGYQFITPSGTANDSTVVTLAAVGQESYGQLQSTPDGASREAPVGFIARAGGSAPYSVLFSSYYAAGGRYLVYGYNSGAGRLQTTSTDGVNWSAPVDPGIGSASSGSYRGRTKTYAVTGSALSITSNGGLTWTSQTTPLPVGGVVTAGGEGNNNLVLSGGYYSTDDGNSWQPWVSAPAGVTSITSVLYSNKADKFVGWVNSLSENINGRMVISSDGTGSSWSYAAASDPELQAQLWGLTASINVAMGIDTNLYYIPRSAFNSGGVETPSLAYIAQVDVSTL